MASDHYRTLGVDRNASPDEIKRAYRRLAREHHPDANPDDPAAEERFKQITHAYDVLKDPAKRRNYDMFGDEKAQSPGFGDIGGISDLFSAFFGGVGGPRRSSNRGSDVLTEVELTLEEAAEGAEREIEVPTLAECETCEGTGSAPGTYPSRCSQCGGSGELRMVRRTMLGNVMTASPCGRCGGTGQEITTPCDTCDGSGRVERVERLTLRIPPGIEDGAQLRVTGRGQAGVRGGRSGDLYVAIAIAEHPIFRRAGEDLGCEVKVPMTVAALGGTVEIPTLEGPETIEVKPGTQSGEVVRLRNRGMPSLQGWGRGQIVALLKIETPTHLDEEQAELLLRLAEMRGEEVGRKGLFDKIKEAFK